jgi:hypothetical protein
MEIASFCHIEMTEQFAVLWAVVSSATWSVLERSPIEAFRVEVVDELLAEFWEQEVQCPHLKKSGMRVCDLILGPPSSWV